MVAIRHVAERAGVSKMSVSRVLNNSPLVNEATRRRVLQAMADLNYTPNASARSLKRGRTRLLGVLIPDINNPIYGLYVDGVKDTAHALGYSVLLCKSSNDVAGNTASLRLLIEHRVTGVVLTAGDWRGQLSMFRRSGMAVVCIDYRMRGYDRLTLDNAVAMEQAVDHLAGLGHRAIGMIAGPLQAASERERLVGYRRAMRRHGLPVERRLQAIAGGFADHHGIDVGRRMLAQSPRPSALVVASSQLTPGVLVAAREAGLSISRDLALVGVGEMSWSPLLLSPITSLVEPAYQMGVDACRMLLERAASGEGGPPRVRSYPARLAVRDSCGAPRESRDTTHRAAQTRLFVDVRTE